MTQSPRDDTQENMPDWYGTHTYRSRMGRYTHDYEQTAIRRALAGCGPALGVLDVGGGDGHHSELVARLGHVPVVLEYDLAPLDILRKKGAGFPAVQGSGLELPIRSATFDVVMTIEVTLCVTAEDDNNTRHFADVSRVLKPNGLFLFTAYNKNSYVSVLKGLRGKRPSYEDRYYLEGLSDYTRKLDDAGFDVQACWGYRWLPFTRDSNNRLIPLLARFEKLMRLDRLVGLSPWLFFAARKRD